MLSSSIVRARYMASAIAGAVAFCTVVHGQVTVGDEIHGVSAMPVIPNARLPSAVVSVKSDFNSTGVEVSWVRLVIADSERAVVLRELFDPDEQFRYTDQRGVRHTVRCAHYGSRAAVTTSADGRIIFSGDAYDTIKLWESYSGNLRTKLRSREAPGVVTAMTASRNGRFLIGAHCRSGGEPMSKVALWDLSQLDRTPITTRAHSDKEITSVSISQDGTALVTGGLDNKVVLWKLDLAATPPTIKKSHEFTANDTPAVALFTVACAISPDGKYVAASSDGERDDRTYIRVWRTSDHRELTRAAADGTPVGNAQRIDFNRDSLRFATGWARKSYAWKITPGEPGTFKMTSAHAPEVVGRGDYVTGLSWWPEGNRFASGHLNGIVRAWQP